VQIREKLATAEAFADVVTGLPMGNNIFAEKLKRIIKMTIDTECESETGHRREGHGSPRKVRGYDGRC
jgi:hypothetical protein